MEYDFKIALGELSPYLRKAGEQKNRSWKNRVRRIYDHEFFFCRNGRAFICIDDQRYGIIPGTLILIKPNTPHSLWMDEEDPADLVWAHFDFTYRDDVYGLENLVVHQNRILFNPTLPEQQYIRPEPILENGFRFPEFLQMKRPHIVGEIFEKLLFQFDKQPFGWQLECKILLLELFKHILIQCNKEEKNNSSLSYSAINSIVRYIQRNYHRKLPMEELSKVAGISPDYLGKIFKRETGVPVSRFINQIRVVKAKELLLNSSLSATDIAEMVGFSDIYYFSKVMKQYEGLSPAAWRKAYNA